MGPAKVLLLALAAAVPSNGQGMGGIGSVTYASTVGPTATCKADACVKGGFNLAYDAMGALTRPLDPRKKTAS